MSTTAEATLELQEKLPGKKSWTKVVLGLIRSKPLGAAGAFIVLVMILMAVFAEIVAPFDPEQNSYELMLMAPDWTHLFGTDQFGRDIFSRIIYGARTALFVGFVSAIVGATTGLVLGVSSAYFGGRFDLIFQRVMDIFMAFPLIILALAVLRSRFPSSRVAPAWCVPAPWPSGKSRMWTQPEPWASATPASSCST
jgi:peptide/nickel transport system permease protein